MRQPRAMETAQSKLRTLSGNTKYTWQFAAVCHQPCCAVYQYHAVAAVLTAIQERREIAMDLCVCCVDCPSVCRRINRKTRFNFLLSRTILAASMHEDVLVCVCVCVRGGGDAFTLSFCARAFRLHVCCMHAQFYHCL